MMVGTKSLLFGYHQFILHPLFVALAWWIIYGFPTSWKLWACFFLHDIGYLGKPNMDGEEGKTHPDVSARVVSRLLDSSWANLVRYHSRWCAKRDSRHISALGVADKYAYYLYPPWLCLLLVKLSGEVREYVKLDEVESGIRHGPVEWNRDLRKKQRRWRYNFMLTDYYVNTRF